MLEPGHCHVFMSFFIQYISDLANGLPSYPGIGFLGVGGGVGGGIGGSLNTSHVGGLSSTRWLFFAADTSLARIIFNFPNSFSN